MLHFDQDRIRHQNASVDVPEQIYIAEQDEVVERTCIGDDDRDLGQADLLANKRSRAAISRSKSSGV
jgi:hypothetical protein